MKIIQKNKTETIENVCGVIRELYQSSELGVSVATLSGKSIPHKHKKMEEVYYVVQGEGKIYIGKESAEIQKGDLIPVPKNKFHYTETAPGETMEIIVVTHPGFDLNDVIKKEN